MDIAVVIPIYKEDFSDIEEKIIEHNITRLSSLDIIFLLTKDVAEGELKNRYAIYEGIRFLRYPEWGGTIQDYNRMCLDPGFYELFTNYKYILICQTDALILGTVKDLISLAEMDYDYYGAVFKNGFEDGLYISRHCFPYRLLDFVKKKIRITGKLMVGNGGLSLRNVSRTAALLKKYEKVMKKWFEGAQEDTTLAWFSDYDNDYIACPKEVAERFAYENKLPEKGGVHPFGVHGSQAVKELIRMEQESILDHHNGNLR